MSPTRIQRRRTRGWRMPEGAVHVGRGTRWGNPYRVVADHEWRVVAPHGPVAAYPTARMARQAAVDLYRVWLEARPDLIAEARRTLVGRDLACWCSTDGPCHGDTLLAIVNGVA